MEDDRTAEGGERLLLIDMRVGSEKSATFCDALHLAGWWLSTLSALEDDTA